MKWDTSIIKRDFKYLFLPSLLVGVFWLVAILAPANYSFVYDNLIAPIFSGIAILYILFILIKSLLTKKYIRALLIILGIPIAFLIFMASLGILFGSGGVLA